MNPIKKLAGQTAIYGLSSVIGRILGYLMVPLYTRVFNQAEYGIVILMFSFVAFVFVFLTYGMETAFFRFSELVKEKHKVYNTAIISLILTTCVFLFTTFYYSSEIAEWIRYPDHTNYIKWLILILSLDAIAVIPFASLRAENRPKRFASIKLINIGINIGLNLFFVLLCPLVIKKNSGGVINEFVNLIFNPEWNLISYVFISNLIASSITIILLLPEYLKMKWQFDFEIWRKMIVYALPLLLTGLAAIMNEMFGRVLLRYLLPENIAESQLGIYSASYKIAILLSLFVQAFRYAAEPFFFANAKESNAKEIYSQIMKYFVIVAAFIFLGIMLYLDVIILFIGKNFREGTAVIPILLMAFLFLGIFYNLSIWYKLTDKTIFGAYLSLIGAMITIFLNFIWIPKYGYVGSAWSTLFCYFSMAVLSYIIGRKHFKVDYNLLKIGLYIGLSLLIYGLSTVLKIENQPTKLFIHTLLFLTYVAFVYSFEYRKQKYSIIR